MGVGGGDRERGLGEAVDFTDSDNLTTVFLMVLLMV